MRYDNRSTLSQQTSYTYFTLRSRFGKSYQPNGIPIKILQLQLELKLLTLCFTCEVKLINVLETPLQKCNKQPMSCGAQLASRVYSLFIAIRLVATLF